MSASRRLLFVVLTILFLASVISIHHLEVRKEHLPVRSEEQVPSSVEEAKQKIAPEPLPDGALARLGTNRFRASPGNERWIALSGDGTTLALYQQFHNIGGYVVLLDARTGIETRRFRVKAPAYTQQLFFSRSQDLIGCWSNMEFAAIDSKNGETLFIGKVGGLSDVGYFSEDGNRVILSSKDHKNNKHNVGIWDGAVKRLLGYITPLQNGNLMTTLSADGRILATWGSNWPEPKAKELQTNNVVQIWNVENQKEISRLKCREDVGTVAISSDGKLLAICSKWTPGFELFDATDGKSIQQFLGRRGGSRNGTIMKFSPDGKLLVLANADDGAAQLWDISTKTRIDVVESPIRKVNDLVFTSNDKVIAWGTTGDRIGRSEHTIAVWEIPSGKCFTPLTSHTDAIRSISFSKDGKSIFTGANDGRWIEWDLNRGTVKRDVTVQLPDRVKDDPVHDSKIWPVAIAPDGMHVAIWPPAFSMSNRYSQTLVFDRLTNAEIVSTATVVGDTHFGTRYDDEPIFSADGRRMIKLSRFRYQYTNDHKVPIWDIKSGVKICDITVEAGDSTGAFSPDGSRLVTTTMASGGQLIIAGWELKTGKKLGQLIAPDPDGNNLRESTIMTQPNPVVRVAAVNNTTAILASATRIWTVDFENGREGFEIEKFRNYWPGSNHSPIAISKDGKYFATRIIPEEPGKIAVRVYAVTRGDKLHTFTGHTGSITALAFSPDGKFLASGSSDTTVLVWDMSKVKREK